VEQHEEIIKGARIGAAGMIPVIEPTPTDRAAASAAEMSVATTKAVRGIGYFPGGRNVLSDARRGKA
jgi:hypothetical protein